MSTDRDVTRIVRSWLEEGATALPDRVLDAVCEQVPATRQRRAWWPARRFGEMNTPIKLAIAAAAVVVIAIVGINLLPGNASVGVPGPSPTPTPALTASPSPNSSPLVVHDGPLSAGTYAVVRPFAVPGSRCMVPPQSGCTETTQDDSISFTFTVPEGWAGIGTESVWLATEGAEAPGGAELIFGRGADLYGWIDAGPTMTEIQRTFDRDNPEHVSSLRGTFSTSYIGNRKGCIIVRAP